MKSRNITLDANKLIKICLSLLFYQLSLFFSIFILKNKANSPRSIASRRILQYLGFSS